VTELVATADRDAAADRLAHALADDLHRAILQTGRASFAVAGGTSPGPVFDRLSQAGIDWSRVTVLPTDERWVAEDDARSNAALIRARLLRGPAAVADFLSLYGPMPSPEPLLKPLGDAVTDLMPLSVVFLGMGADMHTASLFPGAPGLAAALAADAPPVVAVRPDNQPEVRVSLSATVLRSAASCRILIFGDDKRAALERAAGLPVEEAPVNAVLDRAVVHWAP